MENADDDVRGALLPMAIEDTTTPSGKHPESWVTQLRKAMDAHARSLAICLGLGGLSLMVFLVIFRGPPSFSKHDHPENEIGEGDAIGDSILWQQRAEAVKQAFVHAYSNYEKFAYPMDELKPLSKHGVNNFNGFGVSVIDSLDTMALMGLKEEFQRGLSHAAKLNMSQSHDYLPFFETTIRYLGGLLSAYAMSNETIFITKADELGQILLPVFDTPSGLPVFSIKADTREQRNRQPSQTAIAEMGTCQLEFKYLAYLTGNPAYFARVDRMSRVLAESQSNTTGMWGNMWDTETGKQSSYTLQVGGTADSAYEYLLKSYLQGAQSEPRLKDMYIRAANGIIENLVYISPTRKLMYVTDSDGNGDNPSGKLEHLSCFLPGVLALGVSSLGLPHDVAKIHQWAAEGIATTCWMTYVETHTGLGPDEVTFDAWENDPKRGRWMEHVRKWESDGKPSGVPPGVQDAQPLAYGTSTPNDYHLRNPSYQLRPETIESLFILWRTTGHGIWRERGWAIFEAIEKHAKAESGYTGVGHVNSIPVSRLDSTPSWFLAETLKYLFLLASDVSLLPLDRWVLNTEAHTLPIIHWRDWERDLYKVGAW